MGKQAITAGAAQVRAYRLAAHHLARPLPAGAFAQAAGVCGVQNSPPGAFETALWNRVRPCAPAGMQAALYEEKTLLQAWSYRGAPVVFPTQESDIFLAPLCAEPGEEPWIYTRGITLALDALGLTFGELLPLVAAAVRGLGDREVESKEALDQILADAIAPALPAEKRAIWAQPSPYGRPEPADAGRGGSFLSAAALRVRRGNRVRPTRRPKPDLCDLPALARAGFRPAAGRRPAACAQVPSCLRPRDGAGLCGLARQQPGPGEAAVGVGRGEGSDFGGWARRRDAPRGSACAAARRIRPAAVDSARPARPLSRRARPRDAAAGCGQTAAGLAHRRKPRGNPLRWTDRRHLEGQNRRAGPGCHCAALRTFAARRPANPASRGRSVRSLPPKNAAGVEGGRILTLPDTETPPPQGDAALWGGGFAFFTHTSSPNFEARGLRRGRRGGRAGRGRLGRRRGSARSRPPSRRRP